MRDSMIFYRSFYEALKELPLEDQAIVYTAIFEYSFNFNEVPLTGLPKTIFTLIKPQLDANNKRFVNGKKGGRKKAEENQNETKSEPKPNQNATKSEANNNNNVNNNSNNNDFLLKKETKESEVKSSDEVISVDTSGELSKKVAPKKVFKPPTPEEVQMYCDERMNHIPGSEFCDYYESKGWMIGSNKMKDWKAAVRTWESRRKKEINNGNRKISGRSTIATDGPYPEFT